MVFHICASSFFSTNRIFEKMNLLDLEAKYADYQIEMRRTFHRCPEASGKEYETAKLIRAELDKMGIPWRQCGMETGTLATIKGARPGRTILLRGDIDGLEVEEKTGLEYASRNKGFMHACGHDCHISMLLTAAKILNDLRDRLCGNVVLCFQPAEEIGRGASAMIADGALESVDAAFGIHVWSDVPSGHVAVRTGPQMAAADHFTIEVFGKGGHGAMPHACADATLMASAIALNLQTIVSRETDPNETAVVTVGMLESGTRFNVISGYAKLTGTTRCFSPEVRDRFPEQLERIARDTARAMRGDAKLIYDKLLPPTINDADMAERVRVATKKLLGEEGLYDYAPTMGGEDFACYQEKVPGAMCFLGVRNEACQATYAQHHNCYQVDEAMLIKGALLHAQMAVDFLGLECR